MREDYESPPYNGVSKMMGMMKQLELTMAENMQRLQLTPNDLRKIEDIERELHAAERELEFEKRNHEASNRGIGCSVSSP